MRYIFIYLYENKYRLFKNLPCREFTLGFAPKIARLTFAFLPSIIGLGSLHAFSAPSLVAMITWKTTILYRILFVLMSAGTFSFLYYQCRIFMYESHIFSSKGSFLRVSHHKQRDIYLTCNMS